MLPRVVCVIIGSLRSFVVADGCFFVNELFVHDRLVCVVIVVVSKRDFVLLRLIAQIQIAVDGAAEGLGIAGAVCLDDGLIESEDGASAELGGVYAALECRERLRQHGGSLLCVLVHSQYALEAAEYVLAHTLIRLDADIACISVADCNVAHTEGQRHGLDVADEIDAGCCGQKAVPLRLQRGALGGLAAVAQLTDARGLHAEHGLHVGGAHDGKLRQEFGLDGDVRRRGTQDRDRDGHAL